VLISKAKYLLFPLLAAACAPAHTTYVSRFRSEPILDGGSFTTGGGLTTAVELQERDGKTAICGVWAESRSQSVLTKFKAQQNVIPSGSVFLGKQRLVQNLLFLNKVEPMEDYSGQKVNCVLTSRPWQAGDENRQPKVRIPRQLVLRDGDFTGGIFVFFYQTGPGAGKGSLEIPKLLK
jgi:hypothetical protein